MRIFLAILAFAALLLAAGFGAAWWENRNFSMPGPASEETTVVIKPGSSVRAVAESLVSAQVVENALLFRIGVLRRRQEAALKAGEYAFPTRASMADVMDMLVRRKIVMHRITVAEGLTSDMAIMALNADPVLEGADRKSTRLNSSH